MSETLVLDFEELNRLLERYFARVREEDADAVEQVPPFGLLTKVGEPYSEYLDNQPVRVQQYEMGGETVYVAMNRP